MKTFFRTVVIVVVVITTVLGVRYLVTGQVPALVRSDDPDLVTVTKAPVTERNIYRKLLASLDDDDYQLYRTDNKIILVHAGKEFEFNLWSSSIDREAPEMYLFDLDGDSQKEIVVRAISGEDTISGGWLYSLYIFNPKQNEEDGYELAVASQSTWQDFLDTFINENMSQLKMCKKYIQFAMYAKDEEVTFDEATGIAHGAHSGYARALQDNNGKYMSVSGWNKSKGVYTVSKDGRLCIAIDINISYENSSLIQKAGTITFEISLDKDNVFSVTPKSMRFTPNSAYRVAPPSVESESWSYTETNSASIDKNTQIKYISYSPSLDASTLTQTKNLSSESSEIKYVGSIEVTNDRVVLKAKSGCTFSSEVANSSAFSVIANKGEDDEYDIAYTASLDSARTTLTLMLDGSYGKDFIKTIQINFGTK